MKAIWAQSRDGIIGDGQGMPWHIPEDLAFFKKTTMGQPVIMGSTTWRTLAPAFRPLPGRRNIVLSRRTQQEDSFFHGAKVYDSIESLLADPYAQEAWVMGGGMIYKALLPYCDTVWVTEIDCELDGSIDTPVYAPSLEGFDRVEEGPWLYSAQAEAPRFRFLRYELSSNK